MARRPTHPVRRIGNAREQPAQLDRGGKLAALLEDGTDRRGFILGDDEHPPEHEYALWDRQAEYLGRRGYLP